MERSKLNPLIPLIELHDLLHKCAQVIIVALQELYRFNLPHLFDLDVIKVIAVVLLLISLPCLFRLKIALENYDIELTVCCGGYLSQKLYSTDLPVLDIEDCAKVGYSEWLRLLARLEVLGPDFVADAGVN